MRLVSCYIGGFGKIKEYKYDFTRGLNVFCQDNGWGKTTFSVFLKAMFYGMEYSRKLALSEREHYRPWEGGIYGGSLVFETDKKRYRVERTFGKTTKRIRLRCMMKRPERHVGITARIWGKSFLKWTGIPLKRVFLFRKTVWIQK